MRYYKKGSYHFIIDETVISFNDWVKLETVREQNKYLHCIEGPAKIGFEYEAWFNKGKLHREDGPAIINGQRCFFYLNDKFLDIKDWARVTPFFKTDSERIEFILRLPNDKSYIELFKDR